MTAVLVIASLVDVAPETDITLIASAVLLLLVLGLLAVAGVVLFLVVKKRRAANARNSAGQS